MDMCPEVYDLLFHGFVPETHVMRQVNNPCPVCDSRLDGNGRCWTPTLFCFEDLSGREYLTLIPEQEEMTSTSQPLSLQYPYCHETYRLGLEKLSRQREKEYEEINGRHHSHDCLNNPSNQPRLDKLWKSQKPRMERLNK